MKKHILNYKSLIIVALIAIMAGCTDDFEGLNVDPNNPSEVDLPLLFTSGERSVLYKFGRFTNGTDWDTWPGLWTQTFAGNHGNGITFDLYEVLPTNSTWATQYDALNDLKSVIELGSEAGAWHHVGASKVITALQLGALTSYYGSIPYSEALQGSGNAAPKFDSQEDIYNTIFALLGEAVTDLAKEADIPFGGEDFVYGGDAEKWTAIAYALEARYRNHFSVKNPAASATAALAAVANAKKAGFTSDADDLVFKYDGTDIYDNGWFDMFENNQMVASEVFMNTLISTNDPRKIVYWNNQNTDGDFVGYKGKLNGFGTSNVAFSPVGPQGFYGKETSSQLIMTYFELLFIEAEANMRAGNTEAAATALNAAIKAQLDLVTPDSFAYLTASGGDTAAYQTEIATYLSNYASENAGSITMEKIMTEKHKAMVTMNGESWMDVRRHNYQYPSTLSIPINKNTGQAVGTSFIQRVPYPQESTNTNSSTPEDPGLFDKLWILK